MTEIFEFEEEATIEATFQIGVTAEDHGALYNRDAPNQHPISAITGLQDALDTTSNAIATERDRAEGVEGSLSNLTTENKTNLVSAINEVDSHTDTNANNLANHIANKSNPHEVTKAQVGLGNVDNTSDLNKPISTATQNALNLKVNTTDLGNAELDIQKNGTSVGKFTANANVDKVINLVIPTQASDINALPDSTKYGASLSLTINSSTFVVTAQLKDQDGGNLGSAQTIDLPLESVVVNGSYDSVNKKIVLTLENGNTIDIPVVDLVAGLQSEITVDNKLASDLVDDTNQTHKFATSAQLSQISTNTGDISNLQSGKADKATTISGYGITDAYTKTEVNTALGGKQDTIDSSHKLSADLVDDTSTTNKFVTSSEKTTWNAKQDALTQTQLDAVNSGITSAKVTQYDGYATSKANISLNNLNATGQMIIDSDNGTKSQCILEIPQNIKVTLFNNVVTLASGSVLVNTGSTYSTTTLTAAQTYTISNSLNDGNYLLCSNGTAIQAPLGVGVTGSGASNPADGSTYSYFYNTTDKKIYAWSGSAWADSGYCYPFMIITMTSGVASIAQNSRGQQLIFNSVGYIGHHIFNFPNQMKYLGGNGKDSKGRLLGYENTLGTFNITEMNSTALTGDWFKACVIRANNNTQSGTAFCRICKTQDELLKQSARLQYVEDDNICYVYSTSGYGTQSRVLFCRYEYDGTTVSDFILPEPVRTATVEMLATKQDLLTTITGYNSTATQTLKNVNGVLQWVTD